MTAKRATLGRELGGEFFGTFLLLAFGSAVVAQVVLSGGSHGGYVSINVAWGLAVTMAVYASAGLSGAHLNPAVTLALAVRRSFPWPKVLPYAAAQTAGAFAGAALTWITYREALERFDGGVRQVVGAQATAGIFSTYPQPFLSLGGGLVDQIVGTALLLILILALGDAANFAPDPRVAPILVGLAVMLIGMTFGFNAGYAINPARDLGPRLFTLVAGWGGEVFRAGNGWWWVPVAGPLIGGVAGALVYDAFAGRGRTETP
jgi:MIP family channel proteins